MLLLLQGIDDVGISKVTCGISCLALGTLLEEEC